MRRRQTLRLTIPVKAWAARQDTFDNIAVPLDRKLSPAEREVLAAVRTLRTMAEIAQDCRMTPRHVRNRISRIVAKARKLAQSRVPTRTT